MTFTVPQLLPLPDAIKTIARLLTGSHTVLLTTHVNPDGDGLGCELALAEWLITHGSDVRIINHSGTPPYYRFLDTHNRISTYDAARDASFIARADLILVLDCNQPERLRSMSDAVLSAPAVKVVIDHHLEPHPFARQYVIDDDATSTGEIVYRILDLLSPQAFTPAIATALYCAIMTDTGSFRYPRTDPETHQMAAHLIECGADPVAVFSSVYEQWSTGRIHLLGEMLAGLQVIADGRLAYVTITRDMLKRTGTTEEDTDNFTTYPMSIQGVVAGILFLELPDGVKLSVRSKGNIPINELAKEFRGNGHKNAAGARLYSTDLAATVKDVVSAAIKYLPSDNEDRPVDS